MFERWRSKTPPLTSSHNHTFPVDDVAQERTAAQRETLENALARSFQPKVLLLPESNRKVIQSYTRIHPLIGAIDCAFSRHYPLTLSPDAIWLVIAQGFSHHLNQNAETLRGRVVRHQGRQTLTARIMSLTPAAFEGATTSFSAQIRNASDPVLHETLLCAFSTTTPSIRTASEIVLMDTYASYFDYKLECVCGIPKITLTGTLEDWQRIRSRVEVLGTYDLEWWVGRLRPILDEFVRTVEGSPDPEFWKAIYKPKHTYGSTSATGWIADLFPYLGDSPNRARNHVFEYKREHWSIPRDKGVRTTHRMFDPEARKGPALRSFPTGLSSVPVTLSCPGDFTHSVNLVAGYLAVEQQFEDLSLSPVIGWAVTEPAPTLPKPPELVF